MKVPHLVSVHTTVLFSFLLFSGIIFSQGEFNSEAELNRMITTPNSPEAAAFSSYGNIPVNLRVGAPNISVPLYTYKGLEMDLPMSLTYDINARKVEDISSGVGMGWNLALAGSISRSVNGLADDYDSVTPPTHYATLLNENGQGLKAKYSKYKDKEINTGGSNDYVDFDNLTDAENFSLF